MLTEHEIELRVEKMYDRLDRQFMAGEISGDEYRICCDTIREMADDMYARKALH